MANTTDADARNVHGTNPQYLVEKIVRMRIYDNMYWKEHCFGLTASSLIGKAVELDHVGGTFGGNNKPTKFLCLVLKMLQLQPEKDIVLQYITNTEFKYVRALGAFYLRLTGSAVDVYTHLEPLYSDLRKLRKRSVAGWEIIHVDEFVDAMLREETCCTIALPHLAQRHVLVLESHLPGPRASVLDAEFAQFTAAAEAKATAEAEAAAEALAAAQAEAAALAAEEAEAARARSAATERAAVPQDQRHQRRRSRSPERRGEYRRDRDRDRDQRNQRPRRSRSRSRSRERYGGGGSSRAREDRGGGRGGGRDREWDRGSRRSSDAERGRDRRSQRRRSRSRSPPPRSRDYDDRHRRNDRGAAARVESSAPSGPPSDAASAPAAVSASASAPVYGTQAAYVAAKKAAEAEKKAMKKAAKKKKKKKKKSKGGDGGDATDLAGGGSKAELSTDQWNALRAELGMKPLNEK